MGADGESEAPGFDVLLAGDDAGLWDPELGAGEQHSLVDLINRVLDKGVVITGDVTISVAGVDLVYLGLSAILTSVSTARRVIDPRLAGGSEGGGNPPEG